MRIIIVFSAPYSPEYDGVWHQLIDQDRGYIKVNDSCDKIYAFDGRNEEYRSTGKWKTDKLCEEIDTIIKNNSNCECVIMLHDREIPKALTTRFPNRRFKGYSHTGSKFYENYIESFRNGDKQRCFDSLWGKLQKDETVETYLKALSFACSNKSKGVNMWKAAFGDNFTIPFGDTNVCKELKAKGIDSTDEKYKNIKTLFDKIKGNNVNNKIVTAAENSLSVVLKNNE